MKLTGRFLSTESEKIETILDQEPLDYEDALIEHAEHLTHQVSFESFYRFKQQQAEEDLVRSISQEAFTTDDLENPGDIIQESKDVILNAVVGIKSTIHTAVGNFFNGVNRTLARTDKLRKVTKELTRESNSDKQISEVKAFSKLKIGHAYPEDIKELTQAVAHLRELGEWLAGPYHRSLEDYGKTFTEALRNRKKNRFFDKERSADYLAESLEDAGFPIPPGSKIIKGEGKLYEDHATDALIGGKMLVSRITNTSLLNRTESWKRLELIIDQECVLEDYRGKNGYLAKNEVLFRMDVPKRDDLLKLLDEVEKLTLTAKHISNELANDDAHRIGVRMVNSFSSAVDLLIHLALPITVFDYLVTRLRRTILHFLFRYRTWTVGTYGAYVKHAYMVAEQCNKLVEKSIKLY